MEHSKLYSDGLYYIVRIDKNELYDVHSFKCRRDGGFLEEYLKSFALEDELSNKARTYLVRDMSTDELVAYFSLKAGFVSANESNRIFERSFDSVPAVELANFAVNINYLETHPEAKGVGKEIFYNLVLWVIDNAREWVGIDIVYLFVLPNESLINRYKEYGFSRLSSFQERAIHKRIRPRYDKSCIFMFRQL